jgi:transposase
VAAAALAIPDLAASRHIAAASASTSDAADAEAICEAVGRPNMRFVPIKNTEQQAVLGLHRARQGFVAARTAQANQIRGLLTEFGLVILLKAV